MIKERILIEGFTVLSLFDGMSCGQQSIELLGINNYNYFSSEVDKYAMQVTRYNYPNTYFLGSVTNITIEALEGSSILLNSRYIINANNLILIGGSPCQGFSFAGKQMGSSTKCKVEVTTLEQYLELKKKNFEFEGQSYLFWEYVRIKELIEQVNPNLIFLLENVKMIKKWQDMFNLAIRVLPVDINSALVSAQNRKRLYWTNKGQAITQPIDLKIYIKDILEEGFECREDVTTKCFDRSNEKPKRVGIVKSGGQGDRIYSADAKAITLSAFSGGTAGNANMLIANPKIPLCGAMRGRYLVDGKRKDGAVGTSNAGRTKQYIEVRHDSKTNCLTTAQKDNNIVYVDASDHRDKKVRYEVKEIEWRKLTTIECERLQTIADNYTAKGYDENFKEVKISTSQRQKMIGNGWTLRVISFIFEELNIKQFAKKCVC